jgi:hypothetical protein
MQQILNVITKSDTYDLVTLAEMKMKMFIPTTDTSKDALLQELITNISETIAKMCNRVFAYEKVDESYYQLSDDCYTQRLYLSRWPVVKTDIETFMQNQIDISSWLADGTCVLEEETGTIYLSSSNGPWTGQVDVVYSGGYQLPDGAPGTLKFAVEAVIRESYMSWIRNPALFGVRLLTHKQARIGYYGPNMFPVMGLPQTWKTVESLIYKYIRHWV